MSDYNGGIMKSNNWLKLVRYYGFDENWADGKVIFVEMHSAVKTEPGWIPVFNRLIPIKEHPGFFKIPIAPNYCINRDGEIVNINTGVKIKEHISSGYLTVKIKIRKKFVNMKVHRLLMLTFKPNLNHLINPVVNHIDGNKLNNRLDNLEWCNYSFNNEHAISSGLRGNNKPVIVKNIETNEIFKFPSISKAQAFLKLKFNPSELKLKDYLLIEHWEIQYQDVFKQWYVNEMLDKKPRHRYQITLKHPDGTIESFYNYYEFAKAYKLWNVGYSVEKLVNAFRGRYPLIEIEYIDKNPQKAVEVYNHLNKSVSIYPSIREAARANKVNYAIVNNAVKKEPSSIYRSLSFRYETIKPWSFATPSKTTKWVIDVIKDDTVVFTGGLSETAKYLNISRDILKPLIEKNKCFHDFKFIKHSPS